MASVALRVLALAALALALSHQAAAQDPAPATTQTLTSDDSESLQIPAAWAAEAVKAQGYQAGWRVTPPGGEPFNLLLQRRAVCRDEVLAASAFAWMRPRMKGAAFVARPMPHVTFDVEGPKGAQWRGCFSVRVIKRRSYALVLQAPQASFEAICPAYFEAVRSLQSTRSQHPDVPDDWKKVARDGYEYFLHPGRNEADVAPLHKYLLQQDASFAKRFGSVPKATSNPAVVLLVPELSDAAATGIEDAASDSGATWSIDGQCLVIGSAVKGDLSMSKELAAPVSIFLQHQAFGLSLPGWVASGDAALRIFEAGSGRALPQYSESVAALIPRSLTPIRDLGNGDERSATDSMSAMVYVAFLRTAPRPYADKFSAYLKSVRSGGDPEAAFDEFLSAVGAAKLRTDAEAFLASFKPVKSK